MLKKIIILSSLILTISACSTGPDGYLKRSANNKLFDNKGFQGGKRAPLYNKKYISQAKKNILNNSYDVEDYDDSDAALEEENNAQENIAMYKSMIEKDLSEARENQNSAKSKRSHSEKETKYKAETYYSPNPNHATLKNELDEIKSMLQDTKRELANSRCPNAERITKDTYVDSEEAVHTSIISIDNKLGHSTLGSPIKSATIPSYIDSVN